MSEKYVEPMVQDENGNIYFSAKYINERLKTAEDTEIERLYNKLQQKENIIKEARELLERTGIENSWFNQFKKKQLEILDKENK